MSDDNKLTYTSCGTLNVPTERACELWQNSSGTLLAPVLFVRGL